MKEEYVTYEQSQTLKRLGFAEKVNHAYLKKISIEPDLSIGDLKEVHSKVPKNYNDTRKGAEKGLFFYSAPRLDQAQKWLREKHNLSVEPICNMVRQWNVNVCEIDNFGTAVYSKMNLDSYELALSAGIDAALELLTDKLNDK